MNVLIVNRFFGGAQIPTGRMAEDVARRLVEEGHKVTALASTGTYAGAERRARDQETKRPRGEKTVEELRTEIGGQRSEVGSQKADGESLMAETRCQMAESKRIRGDETGSVRVEEVRVPKWMPRALAWLWFTWQARKRIPRMDWDMCVLMTDPPLLPLLARSAARGSRLKVEETKRLETERHPEVGGLGPDPRLGRGQTKRPKDEVTKAAEGSAYAFAAANDSGVTTKRRVAVWLMDLYPEALAASGRIGRNNPLYKWYFNKRQRALGAADLLICLGEAQKALVGRWEGRGGGFSVGRFFGRAVGTEALQHRNTATPRPPLTQRVRTAVVPPWDDRGNIAVATDSTLRNLALYAGNLGEAHCFEEILAAAPHLPGDWTIRFAARGAKLSALLAKLRSDEWRVTGDESGPASAFAPVNDSGVSSGSLKLTDLKLKTAGAVVHVSGYASEKETPGLLASARVHLITISPGWEGIVVPSKLYGCVRTGRPVLFIGPENADTAREIRAHDWGKVLPPGARGQEVAAAILELAARPARAVRPEKGATEVAELLQGLAADEED